MIFNFILNTSIYRSAITFTNAKGGSFVDENFIAHFSRKYPDTIEVLKRKPEIKAKLLKEWDVVKKDFSFDMAESFTLEIPSALADVAEVEVNTNP